MLLQAEMQEDLHQRAFADDASTPHTHFNPHSVSLPLPLRRVQAERYKRSGEEAAAKLATRDGELLAARKEVDQARRGASAVQTDQRNREVRVRVCRCGRASATGALSLL